MIDGSRAARRAGGRAWCREGPVVASKTNSARIAVMIIESTRTIGTLPRGAGCRVLARRAVDTRGGRIVVKIDGPSRTVEVRARPTAVARNVSSVAASNAGSRRVSVNV